MAVEINRITNANIYLAGGSRAGKAEEITLPNLKTKMASHKALGMYGEAEFPAGIDKLDGKIKWNSFYQDVMSVTGDPNQIIDLQVRASVQKYTVAGKTAEVPMVVFLRVAFKDQPFGGFKPQDNVEIETGFTCYAIKMEIDGQAVMEFDWFTTTLKVAGVDVLGQYKSNVGL